MSQQSNKGKIKRKYQSDYLFIPNGSLNDTMVNYFNSNTREIITQKYTYFKFNQLDLFLLEL